MRRSWALVLLTVFVCAASPALPAQDAAAPAAAAAVDDALREWQAAVATVRGRERHRALQQLGQHDDPRVTAALQTELQKAGTGLDAVAVLDAIALRVRPTLLNAARDVLLARDAAEPARHAAARAIARQGNRGIDLLLDVARQEGDRVTLTVQQAAMAGLAHVDDDRAWRGLAPLALRGNTAERAFVLRLLEKAREVRAVDQVRVRLLRDTDVGLATMAWRQLAAARHPKARSGFDDLIERVGAAPAPAVRVELLLGLGYGLHPDAYEAFLRLGDSDHAHVNTAVAMVAGGLALDAQFVQWLVDEALDLATPQQRKVALSIVQRAPLDAVRPMLKRIRAQLERPTRESLELAFAALPLLAQQDSWPDDVRRLLSASDPEVRTTALALLVELELGDAIAPARDALASDHWPLRAAAYRYLTRFREVASIPALIARWDQEDGQLRVLLADALFAHTGVRCWQRSDWESWWREHGEAHALPAPASVQAAPSPDAARGGSTVATYYGIPLTSKRAIFLVDTSGSMRDRLGTDANRTRLDEAKRQLRITVEQMPEEVEFNVMLYEGAVTPCFDRLRRAAKETKERVLARVDAVEVGWSGTNIHAALEAAFADPDVDTIYLLTDGQPTVGTVVDPAAIADQVRRWNLSRQITVHGVSLGEKSALLRRLADESGGQYVFVP
ncbi:MAG: HEAT repeat domain-containing protein [Planctomycetota bacterium]